MTNATGSRTFRSTFAKPAIPKKNPAATAYAGFWSRSAASHASRPVMTKHCATISGIGIRANQSCGIAASVSAAVSQPTRRPPRCVATRNRPTTLSIPNIGAT